MGNFNNGINRRVLPQNFGMYGQQVQPQQKVPTPQSEGIVNHYSKVIDELKEQNKKMKEILDWTIKQKDFYMKSTVDELKKIIDERNQLIIKQQSIIGQLTTCISSSSLKTRDSCFSENKSNSLEQKRETKLQEKQKEENEQNGWFNIISKVPNNSLNFRYKNRGIYSSKLLCYNIAI